MKIYIDEVFAVNAFSQLLMMYSYGILTGKRKRHGHIVTASVTGGIYAAAEAVFSLPRILRAPVLALLTRIAFGRQSVLLSTAQLMLMSLLAEGITLAAISFSGGSAALAGGVVTIFASGTLTTVVYLLSYPAVILCKRITEKKKRYRSIRIQHGARSIEVTALYDSGNLLKYHGRPVILTGCSKGTELSGYESYEALKEHTGAFVLYGTIGRSGVLPVLEQSECRVDGMKTDAVAAVAEKDFNGRYEAIVGEI